jgi:Golgi SNAP receptor complex protein 2
MLRSEQEAVKTKFSEVKQAQRERERQQNRTDLFNAAGSSGSRGTPGSQTSQQQLTEALLKEREGRTLDYAGTRLDEIISMGQSALEGVRSQRGSLKSAHRRVLDAATTLGLSKNVIRVIEQKSAQDKFIFWGGVIMTFLVIYLMWRYFSG